MAFRLDENALLEFAKRVELVASRLLEGSHRSTRGAEGVEFHSAVPYSQGEDLRRIDWKRLAASDRVFIRKYQREEKRSWQFVLDGSASMSYGLKPDWARLWCASLCFLATAWGDSWRVNEFESNDFEELVRALFRKDFGIQPKQFTELEVHPKSVLVVVSDLFFDIEELASWRGLDLELQETHWIQIVDPKEYEFGFEGILEFRDLESSDKLILDSSLTRKAYKQAFSNQLESFQSAFPRSRFQLSVAESSPIEEHLVRFFEDP